MRPGEKSYWGVFDTAGDPAGSDLLDLEQTPQGCRYKPYRETATIFIPQTGINREEYLIHEMGHWQIYRYWTGVLKEKARDYPLPFSNCEQKVEEMRNHFQVTVFRLEAREDNEYDEITNRGLTQDRWRPRR